VAQKYENAQKWIKCLCCQQKNTSSVSHLITLIVWCTRFWCCHSSNVTPLLIVYTARLGHILWHLICYADHSLDSRGSRVLTATGLSMETTDFRPTQVWPPLTYRQKICHRWLRLQQQYQNQIGCKSAHGSFWANAWNIMKILYIYLYPLFFINSPTCQISWRIFMLDGSNDVDLRKNVPFMGFIYIHIHFRDQIPPNPEFLGHE